MERLSKHQVAKLEKLAAEIAEEEPRPKAAIDAYNEEVGAAFVKFVKARAAFDTLQNQAMHLHSDIEEKLQRSAPAAPGDEAGRAHQAWPDAWRSIDLPTKETNLGLPVPLRRPKRSLSATLRAMPRSPEDVAPPSKPPTPTPTRPRRSVPGRSTRRRSPPCRRPGAVAAALRRGARSSPGPGSAAVDGIRSDRLKFRRDPAESRR